MITKQQRNQLSYLKIQEGKENLPNKRGYILTCKTCQEEKQFRSSGEAKNFILCHAGHDTWIETETAWTINKPTARELAMKINKKWREKNG